MPDLTQTFTQKIQATILDKFSQKSEACQNKQNYPLPRDLANKVISLGVPMQGMIFDLKNSSSLVPMFPPARGTSPSFCCFPEKSKCPCQGSSSKSQPLHHEVQQGPQGKSSQLSQHDPYPFFRPQSTESSRVRGIWQLCTLPGK